MAERRGLGAAMALSPEKMAFIQSGPTPPKPAARAAAIPARPEAPVPREPEPQSEEPLVEALIETAPVERATASRPARKRQPAPIRERTRHEPMEEGGFYGQILVPLTTRLQPKTADALRRACLEQKLARKTPNTQQEIVEIALTQWLQDHNFLD